MSAKLRQIIMYLNNENVKLLYNNKSIGKIQNMSENSKNAFVCFYLMQYTECVRWCASVSMNDVISLHVSICFPFPIYTHFVRCDSVNSSFSMNVFSYFGVSMSQQNRKGTMLVLDAMLLKQ